MSYQVLARKRRPLKFEDVVGQSHITRALKNALKSRRIGHAYLFAGTRGVGKTTVARIFAKALRCSQLDQGMNPCLECQSCKEFDSGSAFDVVEIDGASNNSVENIRELVASVPYLPTYGEFKVYIIDEVHMLSTSAFNALLKTLEEPPAHVVFIFATTDPEKLLGTVLSRCQRFDFKSISSQDLVSLLEEICREEGITVDSKESLELLAYQGLGSARDTLSLTEQVLGFSENRSLTQENIAQALGLATEKSINELVEKMFDGNSKALAQSYANLLQQNISPDSIVTTLLSKIHKDVMKQILHSSDKQSQALPAQELFWIYEILAKDATWALTTLMPGQALEMILQKVCLRGQFFEKQTELPLEKKTETKQNDIKSDIKVEQPKTLTQIIQQQNDNQRSEEKIEVKKTEAEIKSVPTTPIVEKDKSVDRQNPPSWSDFLKYLFKKSPATASNLEQGNVTKAVSFIGDSLDVEIGFTEEANVFYEFVSSKDIIGKLRQSLCDFYDAKEDQLKLELKLISSEHKERDNFISQAEIEKKKRDQKIQDKVNGLKGDPLIELAQKIFHAKVDKVVLNGEGDVKQYE